MANLNGLAGDVVGQTLTALLNKFDPIVNDLDFYRQVFKALKQGEVSLRQVQIMESGQVKILPPPPVEEDDAT